MPVVSVPRDKLFVALGKTYTDEEFHILCFDYGIELDDVTSEREMLRKEFAAAAEEAAAAAAAAGGPPAPGAPSLPKGSGDQATRLAAASDEVVYKIDIPANRYDMLCLEGIARALNTFSGALTGVEYTLVEVPATDRVRIVTRPEVVLIRPFIVGAVVRGLKLDPARYASLIDLQDRLHTNLCRHRSLVAIGTHDLSCLTPPFVYEARPPSDIEFVPLKQDRTWRADDLLEHYAANDLKLRRFVPLIQTSPVYPVVRDSTGKVASLPPIINGAASAVSVSTTDLFIECTGTDLRKCRTVLATVVSMFSEYAAVPFQAEPVDVVDALGVTHIMAQLGLAEVEAAAERLYMSQGAEDRARAEEDLAGFRAGVPSIGACKSLLDATHSPYARLLALSSLLKTVTEAPLDPTVKAEMVTYFTCYLESHAVGMEPFVAASLTQLLARVVKAGWAEGGAARGAPGALVDLLARARRSGDRAAYGASLRALTALVTEFNTPTPGRTLTAHRKAAVAFRDAALLPAFSAALAEARRLAAPAAARAVAAGIVPPPGVGPPPPSEGDAPCEGGGAFTPAWAATAANPGAPSDARLLEAAVSLALACLSFDFVGTCLDESADDLGTVQAPAAWRGPVSDPATVALFFQVYASAAPPLAPSALECLVRLASVRRSLFASDAERGRFLAALVGGTRGILTGRVGLDAHASYHELCRLLGRLKTNYQLSELVASPGYPDWVARVADFTISSLAAPAWSGGSVFYLLGLWSRLVSSVPYLKAEAPALLDAHVPGVVRAFICSRLGPGGSGRGFTSGSGDGGGRPGSAAAHASGDGGGGGTTPRSNGVNGGGTGKDDEEEDDDDDLLDAAGGMDGGGLADQMDALPHLCRYRYTETASLLAALFDPLAAEFAARVAAAGGGGGPASAPGTPAVSADGATLSASALENRLAWLVHIISTVIKGRLLSSSAAEATEAVDGDLAARVWALSRSAAAPAAAAARARAHSRARLELALLSFCQAFRKVYVGEQTVPAGKVYARLGPAVGLTDARGVLEAMVGKVGSNLAAFGGTAPAVVDATLALFGDLASGYSSGKTLLTLDATRYLLTADPAFAFPALLAAPGAGRARTALHSTLARLLFMDPASPVAFRTFMTPLERALTAIAAAAARAGVVEVGGNGAAQPPALASAPIAVPDPAALRASVPAPALAGILRDLRGIAASTNSRRTFALLFDWLYPAHVRALGAALAAWAPDPAACTPALKLWAELALNKAQRLAFEPSSPNGILLFREVSRAVVTYGAAALAAGPPLPGTGDPYVSRYKPTSAALAALTRALAGGYANFGVFALYGDPALVDALRAGLGLALAIPLPDVVAHKKVAKAVFGFLETLASSQPSALAEADTPTFAAVVEALDAGLRSLDVAASSQCAAAVDALVAFYLRGCAAAAAAGAGGEDGGMNGHHLHRPPTTPTGAHLPLPLPLEEGGGDAACGLSAAAAARAIAAHLAARPDLFPRLLASLLEVALFEDCPNQWSLSRPMLALILVVGEGVAGELADRALVAHAPDRRGALAAALGRLMAGVSRSLEPRNRDRFTQNLTLVRHEFKAKT